MAGSGDISTVGKIRRAVGQIRDAKRRGNHPAEYNEGFNAGYKNASRKQIKEEYEGKNEEERRAYQAGYQRGSGHNLTTE